MSCNIYAGILVVALAQCRERELRICLGLAKKILHLIFTFTTHTKEISVLIDSRVFQAIR